MAERDDRVAPKLCMSRREVREGADNAGPACQRQKERWLGLVQLGGAVEPVELGPVDFVGATRS